MIRKLLAVPLAFALALCPLILIAAPAAAEGGDPSISAEVVSAVHSTSMEGVVPNATKFTKVTAEEGIAGDFLLTAPILGAVANGKYLSLEAPFDLEVLQVSARAAAVTNPADGDVTVDVLDDGVSILTAPLSYAAADTTVAEADLAHVVDSGGVLKCSFALTGTSPALSDTVVTIHARRHFT